MINSPFESQSTNIIMCLILCSTLSLYSAKSYAEGGVERRGLSFQESGPAWTHEGSARAQSAVVPPLRWGGGLMFSARTAPLVLRREGESDVASELVSDRMEGLLRAWVVPWGSLLLGASVPVLLSQSREQNPEGLADPSPLRSSGVGDLSLLGRLSLLRSEERGFDCALQLELSLPTGEADDYFSYGAAASYVTLLTSKALSLSPGKLRMIGNLGYALLPRSEIFGELLEDEIRGALGLSWTPSAEERWLLESSLQSRLGLGDAWMGETQNAMELTLGGRLKMIEGLTVGVYGTKGLSESAGLPSWSVSGLLLISEPTAASSRPSQTRSPCEEDPWSRACLESLPPEERPSDTVRRRVIPVN